ncbi:MAG: hypothetical protein WC712_03650 [Candidatus Brocadiia bacterium]
MLRPLALAMFMMMLIMPGCQPGSGENPDRKPDFKYSGDAPRDVSLKAYERLIIGRFEMFPGLNEPGLSLSFPERIYNKINFLYPDAFSDVRLGDYDKPGVLVKGTIVEYNPVGRFKRLIPSGRGSALFGVEIVLFDNLSNRAITSFSIRRTFAAPDRSMGDILDETACEVADFLAYCRTAN